MMDNVENIPQDFNGRDLLALSHAVIKFLKKDKADTLAVAKSNSDEFSVAKVVRALMRSSFLAGRPSTPCRNESQLSRSSSFSSNMSTPLKRTLSFSSASSQSSAPSTPIKRESPFSSSTIAKRKKKRRTMPKNTQLRQDIVVVTRPVLELLDADYLSEPQSTLFKKEFRQQKDFHGRRVKRLNATMDEAKFDELMICPFCSNCFKEKTSPRRATRSNKDTDLP